MTYPAFASSMKELLKKLVAGGPSARLVLMPLSRVLVERELQVGDFHIFPPGGIDLKQLRPIPNFSPVPLSPGEMSVLGGQRLREGLTSLAGFDLEVLENHALVAFITEIEWDSFLDASHKDDIQLLQRLSAVAERAMDVVRFELCRLDLPNTLPGVVGAWGGPSPYLGAMLYCLQDHESYLIAGEAGAYAAITSGIGLDFDHDHAEPLPSVSDGEVGAIAVHALSLLSDAMYSRNDTSKFLRIMTLMEYVANPDDYQNWSKSKGDIVCHIAKSKAEYLQMLQRLHHVTAIKDESGAQLGYRTLVIHHGKFLEEVIPDHDDRRKLFRELDQYVGVVIEDMLERVEMTWEQFSQFRRERRAALGVV